MESESPESRDIRRRVRRAAERLMEEKAQLIDELDTDPEIMSARNRRPSNFSIPVFAILTLLFWPLGIGYAIWKWRAGELDFSAP